MVEHAVEYPWSSAVAHLKDVDQTGILDMEWWKRERPKDWQELVDREEIDAEAALRGCTYAGKPFGETGFVNEMAERFARYWNRGRPKKVTSGKKEQAPDNSARQFPLF